MFSGITSINCSGRLWVEPAAVFQMGTNISVYCRASGKNCQPRMLYLHTNGVAERFLLSRVNRTTARHRFQNFLAPRASMYCTAKCPGRPGETLVCGQDITSGCKWGALPRGAVGPFTGDCLFLASPGHGVGPVQLSDQLGASNGRREHRVGSGDSHHPHPAPVGLGWEALSRGSQKYQCLM